MGREEEGEAGGKSYGYHLARQREKRGNAVWRGILLTS